VWILDKKAINNDKSINKKQKADLLDVLRKGPQQLLKLKHPSVLAITRAMDESKDTIAFATEPVFASLANVLGKRENMDTIPFALKEFELMDLEVTMGLLQMSAALNFVHNAEIIHGNLCPESIMLDKNGEWRLAGFDFWCHARYTESSGFGTFEEKAISNNLLRAVLPNLNYLSPEYVLEKSMTTKSGTSLSIPPTCLHGLSVRSPPSPPLPPSLTPDLSLLPPAPTQIFLDWRTW